LANKDASLEEKQAKIDSLNQRIASLQAALNKRIRQAKQKGAQISEFKSMLEELRFREEKLQEELAQLKKENKELKGKNKQLTEEVDTLEQETAKLTKDVKEKEKKIKEEAVMEAESFNFKAINSKGKAKDKNEYKIERQFLNGGGKLETCFYVMKNILIDKKSYDLYMTITDPEGKLVYSDQGGSGNFKFNGQNKRYTTKTSLNYDQTRKKVCIQYPTPKGSKYQTGKHKVQLYWKDHMIGESEVFISKFRLFD
jgi:myosin heavy subunit